MTCTQAASYHHSASFSMFKICLVPCALVLSQFELFLVSGLECASSDYQFQISLFVFSSTFTSIPSTSSLFISLVLSLSSTPHLFSRFLLHSVAWVDAPLIHQNSLCLLTFFISVFRLPKTQKQP